MSLAASWTRHPRVMFRGDLCSSTGAGLGCRCRFGLGCPTFLLSSEPGVPMTPWGADDTPVLRAGWQRGGEGKWVWETAWCSRFLLTPRRSVPAARGLESLAATLPLGGPEGSGWGELVHLSPLVFPSPLQKLQQGSREQTRFGNHAAAGMGSGQPSAPSGAPCKAPSSKPASFPVLMPGCSTGQPSPTGAACFSPRLLPAALPTLECLVSSGLGLGEGPCVRPSSQEQELPRFWGAFQSFLPPHSHFGTEKTPPIAALRPAAPGCGSAGCRREFRSVSPRAGWNRGRVAAGSPRAWLKPGFGSGEVRGNATPGPVL